MIECDYLIVGGGIAGLVMAERLSSQRGATSVIVEQRDHIGGNCHDEYDDHGVLIHRYGPHWFRTNSEGVRDYLSRFTEWLPCQYRVISHTHGRYWSFPVNLATYEQIKGRSASEAEFAAYLKRSRRRLEIPRNSEDFLLSSVGSKFYEMFFKGYTMKQWGRHPRELDASVCGRIPVRVSRNDLYFDEVFQALPRAGYHRLFQNMLSSTLRLRLMLRTDYREVLPQISYRHLVFTGAVDQFYDWRFGALPYRSLRFERESFTPEQLVKSGRRRIAGKPGFWQPEMQVNYPNHHDFTRIVEVKHATRQTCENTTIVREFPDEYGKSKTPYYPVPTSGANGLYEKYRELTFKEGRVSFVGRLATYRYYNMDQVVAMALQEAARLIELDGSKSIMLRSRRRYRRRSG